MFFLLTYLSVAAQVTVIAHRGASGDYPENTLLSFSKAFEAGSDCVELDVRRTLDDTLVVIHDETVDRTTNGKGRVEEMTFDQIRSFSAGYPDKFGWRYSSERIPSLFEVLKLARDKAGVYIDLKDTPEVPVLEAVKKAGMVDRVVFLSYNATKLGRLKSLDDQARTMLLDDLLSGATIEDAVENGCYGVSTSMFTPSCYLQKAHDRGLVFLCGVINDPLDMELLILRGVDGLLTDYPDLLSTILAPVVRVFPNPCHETLHIQVLDPEERANLTICTPQGKRVAVLPASSGQVAFDRTSILPGVYLLIARTPKKIQCIRIVRLH
jgi:glycerophosphoryl diester phosphodiesterase